MINIHDLETPLLLVDEGVLRKNIDDMAMLCRDAGISLRPHIKTHKCIEIARLQMDAGACGITTATLDEAEDMIDAGLSSIFIAFQLVGAKKLFRFSCFNFRARMIAGIDSRETAEMLCNVERVTKAPFKVMIEIDTGQHRAGIRGTEELRRLARQVRDMKQLNLIGIYTHEGHLYQIASEAEREQAARSAAEMMRNCGQVLEEEGVENVVVSVGSTPGIKWMGEERGITEIRAGVYVFNDRTQVHRGASINQCALTVLTTVISVRSDNRVIVDAGTKALAGDRNLPDGLYGMIKNYPELRIVACSEEHGIIEAPAGHKFKVGDQFEIIPNHACTCLNMYDQIAVRTDEFITEVWHVGSFWRRPYIKV